MSRKRKKNVENEWKPAAIECSDGLMAEDFEGLVSFEQLDDYEVIRDLPKSGKKARISEDDTAKKKKKRKKKKLKPRSCEFQIIESEPAEEDGNQDQEDNLVDLSEWKKMAIPDHIIKSLRKLKMFKPTEIQKATIPLAILDRRNIYGAAPTGSGKTLAFAIPIVTHIVNDNKNENQENHPLQSIILTPTRELAVQIKKHIEDICQFNSITVALVVGGLAIQKQERVLLRKKPDILVATPGRLWEIISAGTIPYLNRNDLSANIRYLVIDEADRMVEKAHFKELRFIIDYLNFGQNDRHQRQVFIFSATLTMVKLKRKHDKTEVMKQQQVMNGDKVSESLIKLLQLDPNQLEICDLTDGGARSKPDSEQLKESIIHCLKNDKDVYLYYFLIQNPGRTMVFCNSIDCIRRLLNIFRFLRLQPLAIHSSMPQKRRLTNIEKFTKFGQAIMFATDVAARGLDIPQVDHVIHYQVPRTADIYVHRSGRTARIHNKGQSLILCDPKEEAFFLRDFARIINKDALCEYRVDSRILKRLKERMRLAQVCDVLEHKLRKDRAEEDWFRQAAEQCEIITTDSDQEDNYDYSEDVEMANIKERKDCQRKLKLNQQRLAQLLRSPLSCSLLKKKTIHQ